ncbi:MAG: shikimate kinase [Candidatus Omnitrophica bacterium]|nr:shikimate kinase [Candidatus Omnitrophota bacterium]
MKNIVLVGFMGTGKTVVAKRLAGILGREFAELDAIIEKKEGMSVKDIFENKGEPYFRQAEKQIIGEVSKKDGLVISAGGGAIIDDENFNNLKKNSIIICLEASPDVILDRTKGNTCRPLLNVPDPKKRIEELLDERKTYYKRADHRVNTDNLTINQVVEEVKKSYENIR